MGAVEALENQGNLRLQSPPAAGDSPGDGCLPHGSAGMRDSPGSRTFCRPAPALGKPDWLQADTRAKSLKVQDTFSFCLCSSRKNSHTLYAGDAPKARLFLETTEITVCGG